MNAPIAHGGNLLAASRQYGIAPERWIDLSTGINPHGYPPPAIPSEAWNRLPQDDDTLASAAARYYGAQAALPVAGSQAAIRALPTLLPRGKVGIATLGYGEYAPAFQRAGHDVVPLDEADFLSGDALTASLDHLVVVNPNNPSARLVSAPQLLRWHRALAARGGTLIVDEAFADCRPEYSVGAQARVDGLIVLRSIGKFFGLAGARVGFVLAAPAMLDALREYLGCWTVSGPARHVTLAALADSAWQQAMRLRLQQQGARLAELLGACGWTAAATPLFCWVPHPDAAHLHTTLARQAIWTRRFDAPTPGLRFGLPADDTAWSRLADALTSLS
jgi:cobalamin biosynthetic protein CobC